MTHQIELKTEQNAGNRDPLNVRYWLDGKKVPREQAEKTIREATDNVHIHGSGYAGVYREYRLLTLP